MEKGEKIIISVVVLVTIVVIVGAAVVIPTMMQEMTKPESCAKNCHEMQPFYDSLQDSPHAGIDCHECHVHSGPEIFLYMKEMTNHLEGISEGLRAGKSLEETTAEMAERLEREPPTTASLTKTEHCMKCHSTHKKPLARIADPGISCFKCHTTIAHTGHKVALYQGYWSPDLEDRECVACHNEHDVTVKEETCEACHPPEKHP